MTPKKQVEYQLQQHLQFGQEICIAMSNALIVMGYKKSEISSLPKFELAEFNLITDPYTRHENLTGFWYDQHKHKIGNIQFLSDGSFYAEYDVVKPHPTKSKWFVESISAWGSKGNIKTDAKLLAAL